MELILDTANLEEIKDLCDYLTVDGVTTNPSIIAKGKEEPEEVIKNLINLLSEDQSLFVQVVKTDYDGIMEEAHHLASLGKKNLYVKIPVTKAGLKAIKQCHKEGIKTLATTIYTSTQGLMAALNGAEYLAPYVNRMENFGDGVAVTLELQKLLKEHNLSTKIVAASFKNTKQVRELLVGGIEAVTLPYDVACNMAFHPATISSVDAFSADWQKTYNRNSLFMEKENNER